ncbi:MAG TPA: 1-deoxy-D-xylulose-5-phosphate reductoisomerase [Candidatus Obscuribacterales bacterium]
MKHIAVLGSTGSIGSQTLDIARAHRDDFTVVALAAGSSKLPELAKQVRDFSPELVCVPDADSAIALKELLGNAVKTTIEHGQSGLLAAATHPRAETIVSGVVGSLGVLPTAAAVKAGKTVALANKETLVAAGSIIMALARKHNAQIVPVDSEHSAIHQSLSGYGSADIKRILLTGSGGPFRTWSKEQIRNATVDDALKHPNWSMGPKITIDSATLMNKGLEIIEARWLFDIDPDRIQVVIHPQSILHSAVEFVDGSIVGQLGVPDMHLPIHYALYWPQRKASTQVPPLDLVKASSLTFEEPDYERFPCLALAKRAAAESNTIPSVLNAANEAVVDAFLKRRLKFVEISELIQRVLELHQPVNKPTLDDILEADRWARQAASELLGVLAK